MYMIFASVAPLFIIILIGVIVERLQFVPESTVKVLSVFSLNVAIPCLIFHIMCTAPLDKLAEWRWWLGTLVVQVGFLGFIYFLEHRKGSESGPAMVSALSVAFCNAGFVGLPVIINVYNGDSEALTVAGLMMVSSNVVCIIAQMVIMAHARKRQGRDNTPNVSRMQRFSRFVRNYILSNTIFMSTFLGFLVCLSGIKVWEPLDKALSMLGYVSPSCMLFTLGLSLRPNVVQALRSGEINLLHQVWLCSWRVLGMPLIMLGVLLLLGIDPLWVCVTTVITATGSAIFSAALAQLYQCVPGQAALTVAVTNVLSLFSLMGALMLLTWMGYMPAGFSL